jgi:SAM-dependent methyltransferase
MRRIRAQSWQDSWDRQMSVFQPGREHGIEATLDAVDPLAAAEDRPLRLLDLGGGTGTLSLRALRRWPDAQVTLVDIDPVLTALARASLGRRVEIADGDLRGPDWIKALPGQDFDAVVAVMALHYLAPDRLTALYGEIRGVLRPGGLLLNADRMPDDGMPALAERLDDHARRHRETCYTTGSVVEWDAWWKRLESDPHLGPLVSERARVFGDEPPAEWSPPVSWHVGELRAAGFSEVGTAWRHGTHATVAALRK